LRMKGTSGTTIIPMPTPGCLQAAVCLS
jgi:hypothetical protein